MINVILADDHAIVRQGLKALLSAVEDISIVAEAENGRDALKKTQTFRPDVVVMDFSMPDLNGLEGTRKITRRFPDIKVLALSMHADEEYILQFMNAGAAGYLLKDTIADDLISAIRQVMTEKTFVCPSISPKALNTLVQRVKSGRYKSPLESLTNRQREILQLIAEGSTNRVIAQKLKISIKTVETHRANIMNKLNLHDQISLTRFAVKHNIVDANLL